MKPTLILDFDGTFITEETFSILGTLALMGHPERGDRVQKINEITNEGMNGSIPFDESLRRRFDLLDLNLTHVEETTALITQMFISPSFRSYARELRAYADNIFIVSGGFKDIIVPVVAAFDISADHVFANTLRYEGQRCIGVDPENHMAKDGGKILVVNELKALHNLSNPFIAIGDGYTDWQLLEAGAVDDFYAYTESARRERVISLAGEHRVISSLDPIATMLNWRCPLTPEGQPARISAEIHPMSMQSRK